MIAADPEFRTAGRLARELNVAGVPLWPGLGKADGNRLWTSSRVDRAAHAIREQQEQLLRRTGSLLASIEADREIDVRELPRRCSRHQVDSYWIVDRFHLPELRARLEAVHPVIGTDLRGWHFAPPLDISLSKRGPLRGRPVARVSREGARVIKLWRTLCERSRPLIDAMYELWQRSAVYGRSDTVDPNALDLATVTSFCRRHGFTAEALVERRLLLVGPGAGGGVRVQITAGGASLAGDGRLLSGALHHRWDAVYQPTSAEEAVLPDGWDWDDRPLLAVPPPD